MVPLRSLPSLVHKISPATKGIVLCLVLPTVLFGFIYFIPAPPPLISIEAETEFLSFSVVRPEITAIVLENASFRNELECSGVQVKQILLGLLEPANKSTIQYRYAGDELSIVLKSDKDAPSHIRFQDEKRCELPETFILNLKKPENHSLAGRPLPIAGPGQIGNEYGAPTLPSPQKLPPYRRTLDTMISGELRVFGRTASPFDRGTLYPAQDAVYPLPTGGRLSSGNESLYGVAIMGDKSLKISVTTESVDLQLHRPGRSSDSEKFGISIFVRLFSDPSIAPISFFILFVSVAMQAIFGWISTWQQKSNGSNSEK